MELGWNDGTTRREWETVNIIVVRLYHWSTNRKNCRCDPLRKAERKPQVKNFHKIRLIEILHESFIGRFCMPNWIYCQTSFWKTALKTIFNFKPIDLELFVVFVHACLDVGLLWDKVLDHTNLKYNFISALSAFFFRSKKFLWNSKLIVQKATLKISDFLALQVAWVYLFWCRPSSR